MSAFVVAVLTFVSVLGAALLGLFSKTMLPCEQPLRDDTSIVVRLIANLFVVMTGLVLGLMLNSAKNTLETNNGNIRALATELVLLDRTGHWARKPRTPVSICLNTSRTRSRNPIFLKRILAKRPCSMRYEPG